MKLLIDGDVIAYVTGYATNEIDNFNLVKKIVTNKLEYIYRTWNTWDRDILLTDTDREKNFRDKLATIQPYKGNRKGDKPRWLSEIREYLIDVHGAEVISGIEADDELGMRQTEGTMIVTIDKDLLMVPGRHYDFKQDRVYVAYDPGQLWLKITKDSKGANRYTLKGVGFAWFCAQCFLGDRVDNIPGLRGYGDKKTYNLLKGCKTREELLDCTIQEFKLKKKLEQLEEAMQLLWIWRSDCDWKELWLNSVQYTINHEEAGN